MVVESELWIQYDAGVASLFKPNITGRGTSARGIVVPTPIAIKPGDMLEIRLLASDGQ